MSENTTEQKEVQPQTQASEEAKTVEQPEVAPTPPAAKEKDPVKWNAQSGLELRNTSDLQIFAEMAIKSGLCPSSVDSVQKALIILQHGAELGFNPMMSLQSINVINGKPNLDITGQLALIRSKGVMASFEDYEEGTIDDENLVVTCITKRSDRESIVKKSFSVGDAKRAGLWDTRAEIECYNKYTKKKEKMRNPSPWYCYPKDMIWYRAVGRNLKVNFSDVLKGLVHSSEELRDFNPDFEKMKRADRVEEAKKGNLVFTDEE